MGRDEVDDTDMTVAEFWAAAASGTPVRIVGSRAEYEAARDPSTEGRPAFVLNRHLDLAFQGASRGQNWTLMDMAGKWRPL